MITSEQITRALLVVSNGGPPTDATRLLAQLARDRTMLPMATAPVTEQGNFLVVRGEPGRTYIEEVFAFEDQIYPQREYDGVKWANRILDAHAWCPLPDMTGVKT